MARRIGWVVAVVLGAAAWPAVAAPPIDQDGDVVVARLDAMGSQVYECRAAENAAPAWVFTEPKAQLSLDGLPLGRHFAGPTWELADGSSVAGRVVASVAAPKPSDISWLRLAVVSRVGNGTLTPATFVKRIDTSGGVLAGPCPRAGAVQEVPYRAVYVFVRAKT